jgi:hypothetical protein
MTAVSKKKMETVRFTSPFGVTRFPYITAPDLQDRGGVKADGKFKTGLLFTSDADVTKVRNDLVAAAKQLWPNEKFEDLNVPLKMAQDKDMDTGNKTDVGFGINAKSQRRPLVLDAKKNRLPDNTKIGGGSEIRIGGAIAAYTRPIDETIIENGVKRKVKGEEKGLTIYLNSVQVRKLVQGGGASDGSEFEEVEGFEYEATSTDSVTDDATEL